MNEDRYSLYFFKDEAAGSKKDFGSLSAWLIGALHV